MLSYHIDSLDAATKLYAACIKYKDIMDIDVISGRQIIDAYSLLGLCSLVGKTVVIEPLTDDGKLKEDLRNNLEGLNG